MKKVKTLLATSTAAAAIALGSTPAMAELEASVAVSNIYVFRGIDQDPGNAAVSGDIVYSTGGFYAGIWASSANATGGGEIDTFLGWNGEFGGLGVDVGVVNYYYPGTGGANSLDSWGTDLSEAYLGLSFAGVELYYYDNIAGNQAFGALSDDGYTYTTLSYGIGKFSALVGFAEGEDPTAVGATHDNAYTHLDLTYSFNDNLSFGLSKVIDVDDEMNLNITGPSGPASLVADPGNFTVDDDTLFIISYSLPLM